MMPLATTRNRALCSFLILLLVFASYRPAVCLLSISAASERRDNPPLFPNQNKPRPTRQQTRLSVERVDLKRVCDMTPSPDREPAMETGATRTGVDEAPPARRMSDVAAQPEYLKPFLSGLPYNHLSPPA